MRIECSWGRIHGCERNGLRGMSAQSICNSHACTYGVHVLLERHTVTREKIDKFIGAEAGVFESSKQLVDRRACTREKTLWGSSYSFRTTGEEFQTRCARTDGQCDCVGKLNTTKAAQVTEYDYSYKVKELTCHRRKPHSDRRKFVRYPR